jgi:precorrin-3B C17-methyltransferase
MSGKLTVIGTGPGSPEQMTPQAARAAAEADELLGYGPYVDRIPVREGQVRTAFDNREELERARIALDRAAGGARVCMVSGGDPGVFAMAAAVCEAIEHGPATWRALDVEIMPGVTAMLAVAARAGAPLGHDFCAISLSDNLKPWDVVAARIAAAARAGFVMAFYNPISKARPWQLGKAFQVLADILPSATPVIFGRAAGRPDEMIRTVPLNKARAEMADMATCIVVGSPETRVVERPGLAPLVYSPRFAEAAR